MKDAPQDILEDFRWQTAAQAWGWYVWVGIALGSLLVLAAAYTFIRKKHPGLLSFSKPAHEVALEALEALRGKMDEGQQREFVVEVSQIVRTYIQERFGIRAGHRSTEEFLKEMQEGDQLLLAHRELLGAFLGQCDLVKFAQGSVVLKQMEELLQTARRFVEGTVPVKEAKEKAV